MKLAENNIAWLQVCADWNSTLPQNSKAWQTRVKQQELTNHTDHYKNNVDCDRSIPVPVALYRMTGFKVVA